MNYNRFIGKCIIALLFCIIGLSSYGVRNIIPANEIHYTTIDNSALTIEDSPLFDNGKIVSNSYDSVKNVCILKFDKDVTEIGDYAFYGCSSLTSITIPESVTEIGDSAFSACSSLTSISIPPSVTEIGYGAFYGCSSLTSITVSKDNKVYDSREDCNAINHTESNTLISGCKNTIIPPSVTAIGKWAFSGCESLTSITIPTSVTKIGSSAFHGCFSLTSITIPPSVGGIARSAFSDCSSLTSIIIPPSVRGIGESMFSGCSSLTSISVSKNNKVYDSRENCNAIIHTKSNTLISGCKNTIIPLSVKEIWRGAFSGCSGLTSITIPLSVKKIGGMAFSNCSSLTSITIPESVTKIGDCAFSDCSSLTSISIPPSVTKIGGFWGGPFSGCSSLTEVRIPKGCNVHESAFEDCPNVQIIRY